jgi:hypothetical protein
MLRKILKKLLPRKASQKIEDESKKWFMECPQCGYSISYWAAGGARAYAKSKGKRTLGLCPQCKKLQFFKVIKKEA